MIEPVFFHAFKGLSNRRKKQNSQHDHFSKGILKYQAVLLDLLKLLPFELAAYLAAKKLR